MLVMGMPCLWALRLPRLLRVWCDKHAVQMCRSAIAAGTTSTNPTTTGAAAAAAAAATAAAIAAIVLPQG
jgi:hypothetical protein